MTPARRARARISAPDCGKRVLRWTSRCGCSGRSRSTGATAVSSASTGLGARLLLALIADRGRVRRRRDARRAAVARHAAASCHGVRAQPVVARLRRDVRPVDRRARPRRLPRRPPCAAARSRSLPQQPSPRARLDGDRCPDGPPSRSTRRSALVRGRPLHEVADDVWAMPAAAAHRRAGRGGRGAVGIAGPRVRRGRRRRVPPARAPRPPSPHREVRWRHLVDRAGRSRAPHGGAAGGRRRPPGPRRVRDGARPRVCSTSSGSCSASTRRPPCPVTRVMARRDPMVGRDAALADVLRPGRVVWIEGEPGTRQDPVAGGGGRPDVDCDRTRPAVRRLPASPRRVRSVSCRPCWPRPTTSCRRAGGRASIPVTRHQEPEVRRGRARRRDRRPAAHGASTSARWSSPSTTCSGWTRPTAPCCTRSSSGRSTSSTGSSPAGRPPGTRRRPPCAAISSGPARSAPSSSANLAPSDVAELIADVAPELDAIGPRPCSPPRCGRRPTATRSSVAESIAHRNRLTGGRAACRGSTRSSPARWPASTPTTAASSTCSRSPVARCPVTVLAGACDAPAAEVLERVDRLARRGAPRRPRRRRRRPAPRPRPARRRAAPAGRLGAGGAAGALVQELSRRSPLGGRLRRPAAAGRRRCSTTTAATGTGRSAPPSSACSTAPTTWPPARLAERYLALGDVPDAGCDGLAAQLKAATALIAVGDVGPGRAVLVRLREPARDSGDLGVFADTILAMGPLMTGGREEDDVLADAEHLVGRAAGERRLPPRPARVLGGPPAPPPRRSPACRPPARRRRRRPVGCGRACRASCWRSGRRPTRSSASSPAAARRSLDELRRYAARSHDVTAEAAALLLGARAGVGGAARSPTWPRRATASRRSAPACRAPTSAGGRRRWRRRSSSPPDASTRRRDGDRDGGAHRSRAARGGGRADGAGPAAHDALPRRDARQRRPRRSASSRPGRRPRSDWWPATGWRASRPATSTARRPSPAGSPPSPSSSSQAGRELAADGDVRRRGRRRGRSPTARPRRCGRRSSAFSGHRPGAALGRLLRHRRPRASASSPCCSATATDGVALLDAAVDQERRAGRAGGSGGPWPTSGRPCRAR